jgi:hypothetical protein
MEFIKAIGLKDSCVSDSRIRRYNYIGRGLHIKNQNIRRPVFMQESQIQLFNLFVVYKTDGYFAGFFCAFSG